MQQYIDLLKDVRDNGHRKGDRTGTGTRSVFQRQMRFNLRKGFPLVTVKKTPLRLIIEENLWFLAGDTNNLSLTKKNVHIWDEWALRIQDVRWQDVDVDALKNHFFTKDMDYTVSKPTDILFEMGEAGYDVNCVLLNGLRIGDLGPVYGKQMRAWNQGYINRRELEHKLAKYAKDGNIDLSRLSELLDYSDSARDQIADLLYSLKNSPDSRRHIASNWNASELPDERNYTPQENVLVGNAALAWCHTLIQAYVRDLTLEERMEEYHKRFVKSPDVWNAEKASGQSAALTGDMLDKLGVPSKALSLALTQRSADTVLGVPFNVAGYALLTHMFAEILNYAVDELVWNGGDVHIYENHLEGLAEFIDREPRPMPTLRIDTKGRKITDPKDFKVSDFVLDGYDPHPAVKFPVAI